MLGVLTGFAIIAAIIAVGYVVGRIGLLGPDARPILARLVFFVLAPSLLFTILADAEVGQLFSPLLVVSLLAAATSFAGGMSKPGVVSAKGCPSSLSMRPSPTSIRSSARSMRIRGMARSR